MSHVQHQQWSRCSRRATRHSPGTIGPLTHQIVAPSTSISVPSTRQDIFSPPRPPYLPYTYTQMPSRIPFPFRHPLPGSPNFNFHFHPNLRPRVVRPQTSSFASSSSSSSSLSASASSASSARAPPRPPRSRLFVWARRGVVLGLLGTGAYLYDRQFNASAMTRSLRTGYIG
jgi:hypothetical protein